MKPVVNQLPKDQIIAELTSEKLLRKTNNGNNEVYVFDSHTPALMQMVDVGEGTYLQACRRRNG